MSELEEKKKAGTESSKESSLRDWFKRKGAKGKKGGWVDCNAPDGKGGYKSCGRSSGEKRKKYPACRPTPSACKERGRGKSWGKKGSKKKRSESMELTQEELTKIITEELESVLDEKRKKKKTKKDACYRKVKSRYKVWPSAYASGALSKCRKVGAKKWGNKSKKNEELINEEEMSDEDRKELERIRDKLYGASKAHRGQADDLDKMLKEEDNWLTWDQVEEKFESLFKIVAEIGNKRSVTDKQYTSLLDCVILALYVLVPPRRNIDYCLMVLEIVAGNP